jgi:hypothetical protein
MLTAAMVYNTAVGMLSIAMEPGYDLVECSYSGRIVTLEWIGIEFKAFCFCDTSRVIFADAISHSFQSNPDPCHPEEPGMDGIRKIT